MTAVKCGATLRQTRTSIFLESRYKYPINIYTHVSIDFEVGVQEKKSIKVAGEQTELSLPHLDVTLL